MNFKRMQQGTSNLWGGPDLSEIVPRTSLTHMSFIKNVCFSTAKQFRVVHHMKRGFFPQRNAKLQDRLLEYHVSGTALNTMHYTGTGLITSKP